MGFSISKEATWPSDNDKYYNNQYNNNYHDDYNYDGDNYHDKVSIYGNTGCGVFKRGIQN